MEVYCQSEFKVCLPSAKYLKKFCFRQNEGWHKMRTIVNPVMLKPATVKLYVPQVDEVTKEFVNM